MAKQKNLAEKLTGDEEATEAANFAINYLKRFGWIPEGNAKTLSQVDLQSTISSFQKFAGLPETGTIDLKTLMMMSEKRCGLPDPPESKVQLPSGVKLAANVRGKWNKTRISYNINKRVDGIAETVFDEIISQAFQYWAALTPLKFNRVKSTSSADIQIGVLRGRINQFDGSGGTLAWAYLPQGGNEQLHMNFDGDEIWQESSLAGNQRGILLRNVAAHEIGHLLGLEHSGVQTALMAPFYSPFIGRPQQNDDISRIQKLYGSLPSLPKLPQRVEAGEAITVDAGDGKIYISNCTVHFHVSGQN